MTSGVKKAYENLQKVASYEFEQLNADLRAAWELCDELRSDFLEACKRARSKDKTPFDERCVIRCFGSLIDGGSSAMNFCATALCIFFEEPLNPYLREKSYERGLSAYQRIYTSYRLIANFLPNSPIAALPDERWTELRRALEVRNRIVHPIKIADLELGEDELGAVMVTGQQFCEDFGKFVVWFNQREQKFLWDLPVRRKRMLRKVGRNETCPCGSGKKFKSCCIAAQL